MGEKKGIARRKKEFIRESSIVLFITLYTTLISVLREPVYFTLHTKLFLLSLSVFKMCLGDTKNGGGWSVWRAAWPACELLAVLGLCVPKPGYFPEGRAGGRCPWLHT